MVDTPPVSCAGLGLFMWGFGWGSSADRCAAGAARRCLTGVVFLSYRLDETERESSGRSRSASVGPRDGWALSLLRSFGPSCAGEQRAKGLKVNVHVSFGRAQMTDALETARSRTQVASGTFFLRVDGTPSSRASGIITCESLHGRRGRAAVPLPTRRGGMVPLPKSRTGGVLGGEKKGS